MSECIFCAIADNDAPAYRVHRTERTLAFLDVSPATSGHTVVIPKEHHETLTDLDDALVASMFQSVRDVADAIESVFDSDGITIVQSNGEAAGQDIAHVHIHVLPRYDGDDIILDWTPGDPSATSFGENCSAIRSEM